MGIAHVLRAMLRFSGQRRLAKTKIFRSIPLFNGQQRPSYKQISRCMLRAAAAFGVAGLNGCIDGCVFICAGV